MHAMTRRGGWIGLAAAVLALAAGIAGCGTPGAARSDPLQEVRNPRLSERRRAEAIDEAWRRVAAGEADRVTVREEIKNLAWSQRWAQPLRLHAARSLLADTDEAGVRDSRQWVRLMLPAEQNLEMIRVLSEAAADHGWDEVVPALVRSLARYDEGTPDEQRPEYLAIARLRPALPVARTVLAVFADPPADPPGYGAATPEQIRSGAWEVLARLDSGGDLRASLIAEDSPTEDPHILALRSCLKDLHALPRGGEELAWLWSLRSGRDARNDAWWAEAAAAIAPLYDERSRGLALRHAEPIRWASRVRPEWVGASRAELLRELQSRLGGRSFTKRLLRDPGEPPRPESLAEQADRLGWGDLLAVLVVDEAVHDPAVIAALFAQARMDREDTSAEYGGLLEAWRDAPGGDARGASPFRVVLYPPRPGQRRGDQEFVASSDMIAQGDRALAHYHFHAQQLRNGGYAGPSAADIRYAARLGRTCLVFTTVGRDAMNADVYQPNGVVIDLGTLREP